MRLFPTPQETYLSIESYLPHVKWIIEEAFSEWQKRRVTLAEAGRSLSLDRSVKAQEINDLMRQFARERFNGMQLPEATEHGHRIFGVLLGNYFLRFKKFNNALDVSNHSSKQNKKFRRQIPIDGIPGTPVYLYAGYLPDQTFTELRGIYIVLRLEEQVIHYIDLSGEGGMQQLALPFIPEQPMVPAAGRARLKGTGTNDQKTITGTDDTPVTQ